MFSTALPLSPSTAKPAVFRRVRPRSPGLQHCLPVGCRAHLPEHSLPPAPPVWCPPHESHHHPASPSGTFRHSLAARPFPSCARRGVLCPGAHALHPLGSSPAVSPQTGTPKLAAPDPNGEQPAVYSFVPSGLSKLPAWDAPCTAHARPSELLRNSGPLGGDRSERGVQISWLR